MAQSGEIGPTRRNVPRHEPPKEQKHKEVKRHAEKIHSTIGYSAKDPKNFEKTFLNIAILMHFEDKNILSPEEHHLLVEELQSLGDGIHDGSMKITELSDKLSKIVEDAKYRNPKAKVIAQIIELEHVLCIHPPQNEEPQSFEEFEEIVHPLLDYIANDLTSIQTTMIFKDLEQVKTMINEKGESPKNTLDHLKFVCEDLIKKL